MVGGVGDDGMIGSVEGHITYPELLCLPVVAASMTGVFTDV